ncbi:carboxypeptidase-like regulatory domain-containing protein [Desulfonatronum thioautotrophicum]|uniref:carboxypeptidase-like regulatory domain-containing protein n=1 Tax=Desulfonatronum thioautotrophicum TaxID=617001 RepID=UPI0005EAFA98|nr:carboxypeptidase-like regulatory domain-containing protein [Desulfonatronum thioautotrophicum]
MPNPLFFKTLLHGLPLLIAFWLIPSPLYAHGALIQWHQSPGIIIYAKYDTGQPMAEAQVAVFAPDNPARAWLTGQTDAEGRFSFAPDPDIPGTWAVQARQAGHGAMAHIPISSDTENQPDISLQSPSITTPLQRAVMIGSVVWGCVGTALFFRRTKANTDK